MKRREMLVRTGAAALGLSTFPLGWAAAAQKKKQKVLYFTRSVGYEHEAVRRQGDELSRSEKVLIELGKKAGFEVECTKDGRVFDRELDQYDAIAFFTEGDLTKPNKWKTPPMSPQGEKRLLEAIASGKGFVAFHSANALFRKSGPQVDPYIAMVGGEFLTHGLQQVASMVVTSPNFPSVEGLDKSFSLKEEWYAFKNLADDLHVILVQQTEGMEGACYQRPPYPATWARKHGKGRVFYTSMGHRDDVWTSEIFQQIVLGGFTWALGNVDADVTPNVDKVTPKANQLKN